MSERNAVLDVFFQEAGELLDAMEAALLGLEETPDDTEHINSIFRAMHTIKGSAGFFEFDALVAFAHRVEAVLEQIRKGERGIDSELISTLLEIKDHTAQLAQHYRAEAGPLPEELLRQGDELLRRLCGPQTAQRLLSNHETERLTRLEASGGDKAHGDNWLISLEFKENALRNGIDPLSFIHYLHTLGTIVDILTLTPAMPRAEQMNPESCYLHFKIAFDSSADKQTIAGVFEFAEDDCVVRILPPHSKQEYYLQLLDELPENQVQRLGEMLIQIGALTENEVAAALLRQTEIRHRESKPIGEILIENHAVSRPVVAQALKKQESAKQKAAEEAAYIRVDADKLGGLIDRVGELVIATSALQLIIGRYGLGDVDETVQQMNQLIGDVRDTALQLRTLQIGEIFSRYRRIVMQISDDGAGLDAGKIAAKAVASGLIGAEQPLSEQEIFNLIFEPGLSTKEQADNLSGRGVGLDVVKRAIEALRGSVSVASTPGQGTTVTIHLPLTLAIIDGFMVEAAGERYIIPLNTVEECVELDVKEKQSDSIRHYVSFRGEVLPYLRLGDFFEGRAQHAENASNQRESLVVVRAGQSRAGFAVDALHGEHQTVIKPLGKLFQQLKGISGATVLGSGNVALILDVQELVKLAHNT